jgi:hypothetical protein
VQTHFYLSSATTGPPKILQPPPPLFFFLLSTSPLQPPQVFTFYESLKICSFALLCSALPCPVPVLAVVPQLTSLAVSNGTFADLLLNRRRLAAVPCSFQLSGEAAAGGRAGLKPQAGRHRKASYDW